MYPTVKDGFQQYENCQVQIDTDTKMEWEQEQKPVAGFYEEETDSLYEISCYKTRCPKLSKGTSPMMITSSEGGLMFRVPRSRSDHLKLHRCNDDLSEVDQMFHVPRSMSDHFERHWGNDDLSEVDQMFHVPKSMSDHLKRHWGNDDLSEGGQTFPVQMSMSDNLKRHWGNEDLLFEPSLPKKKRIS